MISSDDFNKRQEKLKKQISSLRKDINYREEQANRGETTYSLDAQINGQFTQINEEIQSLRSLVDTFKSSAKDYGLSMAQVNKRVKSMQLIEGDKANLKKIYDGFFAKKSSKNELLANSEGQGFQERHDVKKLSAKELQELKLKQQQDQQNILDQLIGNVKNLKNGGKAINQQLSQQDKLLNTLDNKMDDNIEDMSTTRRRLVKLLEKSSNCCLIAIMLIEIAAVVLIWIIL